jgi:ABC-2 type transport system permease protein
VTAAAPAARPARSPFQRYRHSLWLLSQRDLRVRYTTSALGYVWSVLDPLLMAAIYYFVFTIVMPRSVGEDPYIVFLLCGLLPWMWFNSSLSDATRAFLKDAKLVRSTKLPRSIWVMRVVLSKGIEFLFAIPVLVLFAIGAVLIGSDLQLHWQAVLWIPAIVLQAALIIGLGLIVAPLVVFFRDLERATKLVLRLMFYASPIVYSFSDLPAQLHLLGAFNPLSGLFSLYRAAFFPQELDALAIGVSAAMSAVLLAVGVLVFRKAERAMLKEL